MSDDLIAEALTEHWGPRCKTKDTDDFPELVDVLRAGRCACCLAWEQYDRLRAASEGVIDRQFAELRFNQARDEAAAELARLRAEVERLKWERDVWREKMDHALQCERDARAALADERAHAEEYEINRASRRLIAGFMLDCNAIGHVAAAENLVLAIKSAVAHRARRQG